MSDRPLESFLPSEGLYQEVQAQSYLSKAGNFLGIKIDMNKPGDTYLNLNEFFHGKVGDNGSASYVPFVFCSWDKVIENATVSISGKYPSGNGFLLKPPTNSDQSVVHNVEFNTGFLREAGRYRFNFILTLSDGSQITSKDCFFDVEQNMINIAFNFANGVGPYDSEYEEWKAQVEKDMSDVREQVATAQKTLSDIKSIAQRYESDVSGYAEKAWSDKLGGNNTWTGTNAFNDGLTASSINSGDIQGTSINGTDLKLNNKSLKFIQSGTCTLEGLASNDSGTHLEYWTNANMLYITGWVDKPKTAYKTFKAYIPTSITNRMINKNAYYVAVNDYDWNYPSMSTNPTEFNLIASSGLLRVNGSGNDGGSRLDWLLPLKDA